MMNFHFNSWRKSSSVMLAAGVLGAAACVFPTDACGCVSPLQGILLVAGSVSRANGTAAAGAVVRAHAYNGACPATDSGYIDLTQAFAVSDTAGKFGFFVRSGLTSENVCIRVRAFADSTLGAIPALVADYSGRRLHSVNGNPADSLMLNLRLP